MTNTTLGLALLKTDMLFCSSFVKNTGVVSAVATAVGFSLLVADTNIPTVTAITTKVAPKMRIITGSIYRVVAVFREIVSLSSRKRLSA